MSESKMNEEIIRLEQEAWNQSRYYAETKYARWVEKAKRHYNEAFGRDMTGLQLKRLVTALSNMETDYNRLFGHDEVRKAIFEATTTPSSISKFINQAFEMATAYLPVNIMDKFVSVQTMDRRRGELFLFSLKKGQTKGTLNTADEDYMGPYTAPKDTDNYSSESIEGAISEDADGSTLTFPGTISNYLPILAATLKYTISGTAYEVVGTLSGSTISFVGTGISAATLTTTGTFSAVFNTVPDADTTVSVDIEYNSAIEDGYINDVYVSLDSITFDAKRYALNMRWLIDSAMMLDREHDLDLEKVASEQVISGMQNERAVNAMKQIYKAASASDVITFNTTPPASLIPQFEHLRSIGYELRKGANKIKKSVRFANTNFIGGGFNTVSALEGLPKDAFKAAVYGEDSPTGMHVCGTFQDLEIIKNLDMGDEEFVMGANRSNILYSGAVYAEFIPITILNPMWNRSMDAFKSAVSYNAFKVLNAGFYRRGRVYAG
jgi:hypothetical protein